MRPTEAGAWVLDGAVAMALALLLFPDPRDLLPDREPELLALLADRGLVQVAGVDDVGQAAFELTDDTRNRSWIEMACARSGVGLFADAVSSHSQGWRTRPQPD